MAGMKEIRGKIKSVQNTRKITKAMEMVAASKMRRAQERMRAARPYADKVRAIAAHMSRANPEYRHPFMVANEGAQTAGIILVTTDKGQWRSEHQRAACDGAEVQGAGREGPEGRSHRDR